MRSPISKLAGHTRLPTFSMSSRGAVILQAELLHGLAHDIRIQMAALALVLICSAGRRWHGCAASLSVCWSPSITASGSLPFSALMLFTSSVVLPEPGLDAN